MATSLQALATAYSRPRRQTTTNRQSLTILTRLWVLKHRILTGIWPILTSTSIVHSWIRGSRLLIGLSHRFKVSVRGLISRLTLIACTLFSMWGHPPIKRTKVCNIGPNYSVIILGSWLMTLSWRDLARRSERKSWKLRGKCILIRSSRPLHLLINL
jgi:hypothetical protein